MKFHCRILHFLSLILVSMSAIVFQDTSENDIFCTSNKCQGRLDNGIGKTNCRCDCYCSVLHDCCGDSEHLETKPKHPYVSCQSFEHNDDAFIINGCKASWKGPRAIRDNCTKSSAIKSDPMGTVPVTSLSTNLTYKNYYCSVCNNDTQNITSWKIGLNCTKDVTEDFLRERLVYEASSNKWGYWSKNRNRWSFNTCDLTYYVPDELKPLIRFCNRSEISACPRIWRNDTVRYKCHSYIDPVDKDGVRYRNKYCALCNGVTDTSFSCLDLFGRSRPGGFDSIGINFALLMDFDFSQGNCVGGVSDANCACGEVYDVYSKRCRQIVCGLPGMRLVNGRCVPG